MEIGSGRGEITRLVAESAKKIFALELDLRLKESLLRNLKGFSNVELIHADILKFDLNKIAAAADCKVKVIGNIPYYISTPIIEHLLEYKEKISVIFITVQKEFAQRITAKPGSKDYGSLSCFLQYYMQPQICFLIKRTSFIPSPKVDSAFLKLVVRERPPVSVEDKVLLFKIIRNAFNQRRKTLKNSLEGIVEKEVLDEYFRRFAVSSNIRPQDMSLDDFARLANLSKK